MLRTFATAALWLGALSPSSAQPVNTLQQLMPALSRCWRPPPGTTGSELTLRFALTRDGRLLGKPMITHSALSGDETAKRRFVGSVLIALAHCTPVDITPELGGAVAGKRLTIRFRSQPYQQRA